MGEAKTFTNPFPGLRPFETNEYRLFFGREGQSDELIRRLQRSRFLAVVGTSGSGKSSLVRAGLLPALLGGMMAEAGSRWHVCIMRPGNDPFGNLAHELARTEVMAEAGGSLKQVKDSVPSTAASGLSSAEAEAMIEATLRGGSLGLVEVARNARLSENEKLLVVVDQFEELFRFRAARAATSADDEAAAFVKRLLEAAHQRDFSLYVVLTMRSDFLGDCAQFQGLPEAINDGQYLIPRMTRDERRMAITGPVGVTRGKMAEPLINRLLNDVGDNPDQLPILQHALMRTWDYWARYREDGEPIGLNHYQAIGTMERALSIHADEAWRELPDERSRQIAESLFRGLTERGADNREIRRPSKLSEICGAAEADLSEVIPVIELFRREGRSFLMPPAGVPLKPDTVIDISHESLIRNWDRLQEWVDEEAQSARIYRRLAEDAVLHREGQEGLLIDPALQIAIDWQQERRPNAVWARRYQPEFDTAIAYLEASRRQRDAQLAEKERQRQEQVERDRRELEQAQLYAAQQRRAARRLRWLAAGMAVMFLLAMIAVGVAFKLRSDAVTERDRARRAETNAEAQSRIARDEKQRALDEFERAEGEKKKAQGEFQRAEDEKKKAQGEFQRAEAEKQRALTEAARANTQAGIAARNLKTAQQATTAASSIVRRAIPVVSQGNLLLKGSEAYRRAELDQALNFFTLLRQQLEGLSSSSSTQTQSPNLTIEELQRYARDLGQYEQFNLQLGWTLSHIGSTQLRKGDQASAIDSYEKSLKVLNTVAESSTDPIVLETYLGLAEAYQGVAVNGRPRPGQVVPDKSDAPADFKKAEDYLERALNFQQGALVQDSRLVADTHLRLARLYVDAGKPKQAEASYKRAVEGKKRGKEGNTLETNERAELAAAMRELAEFYQSQENGYESAVRAFNEMITVQEDISVYDLAGQGQEIANSYSDLGQIYLSKGETRKAEDVFRVANLLQQTALKMRRLGKLQNTSNGVATLRELAQEVDDLGDAYFKLGKFSDAEALYNASLENRRNANDPEVWKSYDKLARLYRAQKDYAKAAESYNELREFYRGSPQSADYAKALFQIAATYAEDPNAPPDAAVSNYRSAFNIYDALGDWDNSNIILFRLTKIYEKRKQEPERIQALKERVTVLAKYFDQLAAGKAINPKLPLKFANEYMQAIYALAYAQTGKNDAEAVAAYQRAFEARAYFAEKVQDEKVLKFYAAVLGNYETLLKKLNSKSAGEVAKVAQGFRDRLSKAEESKLTSESRAAAY